MCVLRRYGKQFDCAFQTKKNKIIFSFLLELHNKIKSQALRKIEKSINRIDFFSRAGQLSGITSDGVLLFQFRQLEEGENRLCMRVRVRVCVFVFHADATYTHTPTRTSSRKCKRTHTHSHAHLPARPGAPRVNTLAVN